MDTVFALMQPQVVVTVLAAVAAFATVLTVLMPVLNRDRLDARMQVMATERDKMRAARLAGTHPAAAATMRRTSAAPASVPGSRASTPYSSARLTNCAAHQLAPAPIPTPTTVRSATCVNTSVTTPLCVAPSAIRIPISPRRLFTACVVVP